MILPNLFAAGIPTLSPSTSLTDDLRNALRKGNPLFLMVSLEGCVFCRVVRESQLLPMHKQSGLDVVLVDIRTQQISRDFKGLPLRMSKGFSLGALWSPRLCCFLDRVALKLRSVLLAVTGLIFTVRMVEFEPCSPNPSCTVLRPP